MIRLHEKAIDSFKNAYKLCTERELEFDILSSTMVSYLKLYDFCPKEKEKQYLSDAYDWFQLLISNRHLKRHNFGLFFIGFLYHRALFSTSASNALKLLNADEATFYAKKALKILSTSSSSDRKKSDNVFICMNQKRLYEDSAYICHEMLEMATSNDETKKWGKFLYEICSDTTIEKFGFCRYVLAMHYERQGRIEDATHHYEKCIEDNRFNNSNDIRDIKYRLKEISLQNTR